MNPMKLGEPQVDDKHSIFATLYFQRMLQNELIDLHILKRYSCNPYNFVTHTTLIPKSSSLCTGKTHPSQKRSCSHALTFCVFLF